MSAELFTLLMSAITISFLHTASGPDHYLPFIFLSRARNWSKRKTIGWTILCGFGHIASSLLLGLVGLLLGWQLTRLNWFQNLRGDISAWCLLTFGLLYLAWGSWKAVKDKPHKHFEMFGAKEMYVYEHRHGQPIVLPQQRIRVTPWVLFAIFVMGPSEPLLPLLFYSGSNHSYLEISLVIGIFTLTTIGTMLLMVILGTYGYSVFKPDRLERYTHALGGLVITICGLGMLYLNW